MVGVQGRRLFEEFGFKNLSLHYHERRFAVTSSKSSLYEEFGFWEKRLIFLLCEK